MDKEDFSPFPLGWIARHVFQHSIYSLPTAEKEIRISSLRNINGNHNKSKINIQSLHELSGRILQ
jgi:hypothetical protein